MVFGIEFNIVVEAYIECNIQNINENSNKEKSKSNTHQAETCTSLSISKHYL